jgi:hypothetical protein
MRKRILITIRRYDEALNAMATASPPEIIYEHYEAGPPTIMHAATTTVLRNRTDKRTGLDRRE